MLKVEQPERERERETLEGSKTLLSGLTEWAGSTGPKCFFFCTSGIFLFFIFQNLTHLDFDSLGPVWMDEKGRSKLKLVKNKLSFGQLYSLLISFPPSQSKHTIKIFSIHSKTVKNQKYLS